MKIRAGEWDTQQTNEPLEYQVKLFLISISIRKTILNNFIVIFLEKFKIIK